MIWEYKKSYNSAQIINVRGKYLKPETVFKQIIII